MTRTHPMDSPPAGDVTLEDTLDDTLRDTFPASDPPSTIPDPEPPDPEPPRRPPPPPEGPKRRWTDRLPPPGAELDGGHVVGGAENYPR